MVENFKDYIKAHHLISFDDKILLAISGGVDSIVMLHLFREAGYNFSICHCNFKLRVESDNDEDFVRQIADDYGKQFFAKRFETWDFASKHKVSIQMAARRLRYQWFEELQRDYIFDRIATAHHIDDSVETIILNLLNGSGINGLTGIPLKNNNIIRPMLFANKDQIVAHAKKRGYTWREDSSNDEVYYQRNYIRNKILPLFKEINQDYQSAILRSAEKLSHTEEILENKLNEITRTRLNREGASISMDLYWVIAEPGGLVILHEMLKCYGFNYKQVQSICKNANTTESKRFLSEQYEIIISRNKLLLEPRKLNGLSIDAVKIDSADNEVHLSDGSIFKFESTTQKVLINSGQIAQLDLDKLQFPLIIRNWQEGDRFMPLGMTNKKKLSDFMIDEKIPVNLKSSVKVMVSDEDIIWVVGYRIDDRYKLTKDTTKVLRIEYLS